MLMGKNELMTSFYQSLGLVVAFYSSVEDSFLVDDRIEFNYRLLIESTEWKSKLNSLKEEGVHSMFFSNEFNCVWITIPLKDSSIYDYCIIGPSLINAVAKEQVVQYYYRRGVSLERAIHISKEFEHVPIVPYSLLSQLFNYIYFIVTGKKSNILDIGGELKSTNEIVIVGNKEELYEVHKEDFISSTNAEKYICDCVRNGNVEGLKMRRINVIFNIASLSTDDIRSLKNNFIIAIALVTRAAIEGGLATEIAFPLSDMYILQLESISEITKMIKFYHSVLEDITLKVQKNNFKVQFSRTVNRCCGYVISNVKSPLKVSDIAENLDIHPDTLSRKFKEETGETLLNYIRKIKIEEAKMLLLHTNKTLADISNILSFSSQSQFIVSFKKVEGLTPNEFRSKQSV